MPELRGIVPDSPIEAACEILHGVPITDPYRWLEEQESPRTREWLRTQQTYTRCHLDAIPGRDRIRNRIRELVDIETYDSIQKVGQRYFFRKRLRGQEQPCIFMRDGAEGPDELLLDPAERGFGSYKAVRPIRVSPDGRLLLYEVKQGGERTGQFEFLDIAKRQTLPDALPTGYLRGFAFSPDSNSFYYVHEPAQAGHLCHHAAYQHTLGETLENDREIFSAGNDQRVRLQIVPGSKEVGFLVLHFGQPTLTDFFLWSMASESNPQLIIRAAAYKFGPLLLTDGRIFAITDRDAPNFRIVEVHLGGRQEPEFVDVVPETSALIQNWTIAQNRIFVSYVREFQSQVDIFDLAGRRVSNLPVEPSDTIRLLGGSDERDEVLFEAESFARPARIYRYSPIRNELSLFAARQVPVESHKFANVRVWFPAKDGTRISMSLVGLRNIVESGLRPVIMTAYGGHGVSMTPQFSVFVLFLMERGCVFALPNIRGGSELGSHWHRAAKRRNRQVAFDDFVSAAEWLIETGRTEAQQLAIFGGSNSGLLVGVAMTQRPELFRAVVCMVPILDMLRYHLFDNAHVWRDEYGVADDRDDFPVLLRYSPYHNVRDEAVYPATMIISGDSDQNCNPLHARKMTARLQAASKPGYPTLLDYSPHRGHSPVLPLSERIEALTDRMAFLTSQLKLAV